MRVGDRNQGTKLVTGWKTNGQAIVALETMQGEIEADEFVLCGGVWSEGLVKQLKLQLPLQPGKGYSLTTARTANIYSI